MEIMRCICSEMLKYTYNLIVGSTYLTQSLCFHLVFYIQIMDTIFLATSFRKKPRNGSNFVNLGTWEESTYVSKNPFTSS